MIYKIYFIFLLSFVSIKADEQIEQFKKDYLLADSYDKAYYLTEIAKYYHEISADSAIKYAELALNTQGIDNFLKEKSMALICLGNAYYLKSDFNRALDFFTSSVNLLENNDYKYELATAYKGFADVHKDFNANYEIALEEYFKSLNLFKELDNIDEIIKLNKAIGELYLSLKQPEKALEYFHYALEIAQQSGDEEDFVATNHKIGKITIMSGNPDEGVQYCLNSLEISKNKGYKITEALIRSDLADMFIMQNMPDKALEFNNIALKYNDEFGNISGVIRNYSGIANAYIEKKEYDKAIKYCLRAIAIAEENKIPENNYYEIYEVISIAYQRNKEYSKALESFKNFSYIKDKIFNSERSKQISELQIAHDLQRKENEINELMVAEQRNQIVFTSVVSILILIVAVIFFALYRNKRKNAIQLEKAKIEAEKADKLKTEILANMTHEIKTPLSFINSSAMLLKLEMDDKMTEDSAEALDGLDVGVKRLNRTVDLYMILATIKSGNYISNVTTVNIDDLINGLCQDYRILGSKEKERLQINYVNQNQECLLNVDENAISVIVRNIIDNAYKYTNEGSIDILFHKVNKKCTIEIKDTGIGINEEYFDKLFEPFTQEEMAINRSYDGNGLGLALANEFAKIINAQITFESKKGVGSKFIITLN